MADYQTKSNKQKRKELKEKKAQENRRIENERITHKPKPAVLKAKVRNLGKAIEEVFAGTDNFEYSENKIHYIKEKIIGYKKCEILKRILIHFVNQKVEFTEGSRRDVDAKLPLNALINLSLYAGNALRVIEDWIAPSHNTHRCIASFARHLYGKYHIPAFLDQVWYFGNKTHHKWFLHVAKGNNIRNAENLPIPLTKKEAHYYMQAPKDFTPLHAFYYGQILNMGGNIHFVRQILKTRIANDLDIGHARVHPNTIVEKNKFWLSVFTWFMANPMLDTAQYAPIVDYINNQKYTNQIFVNNELTAIQPNFCMKGRDPETLLRQVEAWHKETGSANKQSHIINWLSSGIKPLWVKSEHTLHKITEILTNNDLREEGRKMRHCVGSYASSCHSGRVSIWSYEFVSGGGTEKKLTLEVTREKQIIQARGKSNAIPTESEMHYVKLWARESGLTISRYLM